MLARGPPVLTLGGWATIRALRLVLRDELEGWARDEQLVQSLLRSEVEVRRAAHHQARLEAVLTMAALAPPVSRR